MLMSLKGPIAVSQVGLGLLLAESQVFLNNCLEFPVVRECVPEAKLQSHYFPGA